MARKTARKPRNRSQLTKAELQAYEARRADERKRVGAAQEGEAAAVAVATPRHGVEHSFELNRDDEFAIIRSDLMRLLVVMAIIVVLLVVATFALR